MLTYFNFLPEHFHTITCIHPDGSFQPIQLKKGANTVHDKKMEALGYPDYSKHENPYLACISKYADQDYYREMVATNILKATNYKPNGTLEMYNRLGQIVAFAKDWEKEASEGNIPNEILPYLPRVGEEVMYRYYAPVNHGMTKSNLYLQAHGFPTPSYPINACVEIDFQHRFILQDVSESAIYMIKSKDGVRRKGLGLLGEDLEICKVNIFNVFLDDYKTVNLAGLDAYKEMNDKHLFLQSILNKDVGIDGKPMGYYQLDLIENKVETLSGEEASLVPTLSAGVVSARIPCNQILDGDPQTGDVYFCVENHLLKLK